jgi:hypothetical protein
MALPLEIREKAFADVGRLHRSVIQGRSEAVI